MNRLEELKAQDEAVAGHLLLEVITAIIGVAIVVAVYFGVTLYQKPRDKNEGWKVIRIDPEPAPSIPFPMSPRNKTIIANSERGPAH